MEPCLPTRPAAAEDELDGGRHPDSPVPGGNCSSSLNSIHEDYVALYTASYELLGEECFKYNMNHGFRGFAIIINNQTFKKIQLPDRLGSDLDREALKEVCLHLGFAKDDIKVWNNRTVDQMKSIVAEYAENDRNTEADCFMLFILSHGDVNDSINGYDDDTTLPEIIRPLKMSPSLVGKPKIVFVQACRGKKFDSGNPVRSHETDSGGQNGSNYTISEESDFFYGYSTAPGYYSWRCQVKGSWYVQAIYEVFMRDGSKYELNDLMARVAFLVSYQYKSCVKDEAKNNKKQSPFCTSTLTKKVYFEKKLKNSNNKNRNSK